MTEQLEPCHDDLYERVAAIIEAARGQIARSVNSAMVHAYWLIGHEFVETEQHGHSRATCGDQLVASLAGRLSERYGRGFGASNIKRMRQFYLSYPDGSALPAELGGPDKGAALGRRERRPLCGAPPAAARAQRGHP